MMNKVLAGSFLRAEAHRESIAFGHEQSIRHSRYLTLAGQVAQDYGLWTCTQLGLTKGRVLESVHAFFNQGRGRVVTSFAIIWMLWMVIGSISAYDCFQTLKYALSLNQMEENAISSYIMRIDPGVQINLDAVATFCGLKCCGTVLVILILNLLYQIRRQYAVIATWAVFFFQVWLLTKLFVPIW